MLKTNSEYYAGAFFIITDNKRNNNMQTIAKPNEQEEQICNLLCSKQKENVELAKYLIKPLKISQKFFCEKLGYNLHGIFKFNDFITKETWEITTENCNNPAWGIILPRMTEINARNKNLKCLPSNLPSSIFKINCSNNQLASLPDTLPANLQVLYCVGNQLTSLPNTLPANLQELYCGGNQLTSLPDTLPANLQELYCGGNQLTSLPDTLPAKLQELYCYDNQLTSLPDTLPANLKIYHDKIIT